jgi:hypothetical protein
LDNGCYAEIIDSRASNHWHQVSTSGWASSSYEYIGLANLILSINDTYYPNGEWQAISMYYTGMAGDRVVTATSSNLQFDMFGSRDGNSVKIIAGSRPIQAPYDINISGLSYLGLGTHESIEVHTYRFDWTDPQD